MSVDRPGCSPSCTFPGPSFVTETNEGYFRNNCSSEMNVERRLAAILAADVVGFAGLVASNESKTLARLDHLRRDILGMWVEVDRGRVFKSLGDGFLAEFSSTVEAVHCAIGIQEVMALEAQRSDEREPLLLRIGVSLGDVMVQGADVLGHGVNIAARLGGDGGAGRHRHFKRRDGSDPGQGRSAAGGQRPQAPEKIG